MSSDALAWVEERIAEAEAATPGPWVWDRVSGDLVNPTIIDEELGDFGSVIARYSRSVITGYCHDEMARKVIARHDPTTMRLVWAVVEAAERRRQAEIEYHRAFPEAADLIARGELHPFTDLSVDDALDALWAHVLGAGE